MAPEHAGCAGHRDLAGEFRDLGRAALDRLEPWLALLHEHAAAGVDAVAGVDGRPAGADSGEAGADPAPIPAACAVCPICAVIALIRGERSELALRLSDQAAGFMSVLRTALDEGGTAPPGAQAEAPPGSTAPQHGSGRSAQHIAVVRADPPAG